MTQSAIARALKRCAPNRCTRSFYSAVLCIGALAGCDTLEGKVLGGAAGITAFGAQAPSPEIQQTYYLGVFDPQSQLEPTVYRVRLHGQSSALNTVHFASGWLPSMAVDNLGTSIKFDKKAERVTVKGASGGDGTGDGGFQTGRRLVVFGPEGFREAPADHRLVVYMGSSPEQYFNTVTEALGTVADVSQTPDAVGDANEFRGRLLEVLRAVTEERRSLDALKAERDRAFAGTE